ncbi:helix-turn-helix domain-containing protein [Streptomyces violascens]
MLRIVRRGRHDSTRVRRAMIVMASASGNTVPAIARLVAASPDTFRVVIHDFNARGLAALDPRWAGGRRRQITPADEAFMVQVAGWGSHSPTGACGNSPTIWPITHGTGCGSGANGSARSWPAITSPSNVPGPGRRPPTPRPAPSWTGSRR